MDIRTAIKHVVAKRSLSEDDMSLIMTQIITGQVTSSQIACLVTALHMKGETVDEIVGAARSMRSMVKAVTVDSCRLVDTCGTGGDGVNTFNISTTSAFVVASAGAKVAKHGNRSVSSVSGSADVLERAGVNLGLNPEQVARCIECLGIGFLFAPAHHGSMSHAKAPRQEIGIKTLFNLLGPLANPAGADFQVLGVYHQRWLRPMAEALQRLGTKRALVVHGADGLDEITISDQTLVIEVTPDKLEEYAITPEEFGLERSPLEPLKVSSTAESLKLMRGVLGLESGPAQDIVVLNAGAALYVTGVANSITDGVRKAQVAIGSGKALIKLDELIDFSQSLDVKRLESY